MIEINYNDEFYPEKLKKIKDPPFKLYAEGNLEILKKDSIAVVGTRHISMYGIRNCKNIVSEIAKRDIPVISGMAEGTDTVAHETILECKGETIAVLGNGFNKIFPKKNEPLFKKIIENNGLVLTEYAPDISAKSENFLRRNRIVSGLSVGVLVIEAGHRSGTSVTAQLAKNQGKVVMALPGRLDDYYGIGVNKLIQNGAKLITNIDDILINFPQFMDKKLKKYKENQFNFFENDDEHKKIAELLRKNEIMSVEEIHRNVSNKSISEIMEILIDMEFNNIVTQEIGAGYKLVRY